MSPTSRTTRWNRSALLVALWLALPLAASAQSVPPSSSTAPMDMSNMPGMSMPAASSSTPRSAMPSGVKKPGKKPSPTQPTPSSHGMEGMPGMDHPAMPAKRMPPKPVAASSGMDDMEGIPMPAKPAASTAPAGDMSGMDHASMPGMSSDAMQGMNHRGMAGMDHGAMPKKDQGEMAGMGAMPGMTMGPMQGGSPPPNARSPDYSDGVGYGSMEGMDMADKAPLGMVLIDQLEAFHGRDANGQSWEAGGWYGNDENKLWIRTEGERSRGKLDDGDLEAFWNHAIATYWSTQLGARQDIGAGPKRTWAAFGVQGLAPYWFELEATGYVGTNGRTAARLRAEYELLFTQRLILQPEAEVNLYGKDDPQRRIGSGVSDLQFGLRLRYEFHRQFAPYIGVNWTRRVGTTADYARQDHQPVLDRQIVAGVRIWF
ncbi:copper resistance protein B [Rhodanobacter glycinis]|uniref:Copper resistance protein B n=1 Tax=Rhodanobacter glycinis TaxID=582702 RepID=A0A1I3YD21_9GAMM|nr:copper resistance protein B [Rhodanobacter glycinis]SFK29768.1 copper resistance protein B [Rhodanobacter glycinis]